MSTDALVHFVEPWPSQYTEAVRDAVAQVEASPGGARGSATAAPWVMSHYAVNGLELFVAQRRHRTCATTARSVSELCRNLHRMRDCEQHAGPLFQLMYVSKAVEPMTEQELTALLVQARQRNSKLGITGVLMYRQQRFLQLLEGLASAVHEVFTAIAQDPRHEQIQTLFTSPIERRTFPDWQMGFVACEETSGGSTADDPAEAVTASVGEDLCIGTPLVGNVSEVLQHFRHRRRA